MGATKNTCWEEIPAVFLGNRFHSSTVRFHSSTVQLHWMCAGLPCRKAHLPVIVSGQAARAGAEQLQCGIAGELADVLQPSTLVHENQLVFTSSKVMLWQGKNLSQRNIDGVVHFITSTSL
jgi:hypothetical protein